MTFLLFLAGIIIFGIILYYIMYVIVWTDCSNAFGITRKFTYKEVKRFYNKLTLTIDYNRKGIDKIKLNQTYIQVTYMAYIYIRRRYSKELKRIYRKQEQENTDRLLKELEGDNDGNNYGQS